LDTEEESAKEEYYTAADTVAHAQKLAHADNMRQRAKQGIQEILLYVDKEDPSCKQVEHMLPSLQQLCP
jgi:hypothetical protein